MTQDDIRADNYFAMIPEWVLYGEISATAVRLYCVLHRYADKGSGKSHPSRRTLAEKCHCSVRTIDGAVSELIELGALRRDPQWSESGDRTSNTWTVVSANSARGSAENGPTPGAENDTTGGAENDTVTIVSINQSQSEPKKAAVAKNDRPRDLIFEAVCAVTHTDWRQLPPSQRSRFGKVTKELKAVDATPEEIGWRAKVYRTKYPDMDLTPEALLKHWASLQHVYPTGNRSRAQVGLDFLKSSTGTEWDDLAKAVSNGTE